MHPEVSEPILKGKSNLIFPLTSVKKLKQSRKTSKRKRKICMLIIKQIQRSPLTLHDYCKWETLNLESGNKNFKLEHEASPRTLVSMSNYFFLCLSVLIHLEYWCKISSVCNFNIKYVCKILYLSSPIGRVRGRPEAVIEISVGGNNTLYYNTLIFWCWV